MCWQCILVAVAERAEQLVWGLVVGVGGSFKAALVVARCVLNMFWARTGYI
jgi:hypothetical protein